MLNLITKSKIRQKAILLFVYNPAKAYYISEVAKLIKTSPGTAQRELEKLAKESFLTKEKKANLAYFKLNTFNPLLPDIISIINKTIGIEAVLKKELQGAQGIDFAFLFGSYVKGDFNAGSDIDLYVIGEISEKELYKKLRKVEEKIDKTINYHLALTEEFKKNIKKSFFYKEILTKYILVKGAENEFRKFIK